MRGSIAPVAPPTGFRPFDLTIRVETKDDLAALYARFNMSGETLAPAVQTRATINQKSKGPYCSDYIRQISRDPEGKRQVWKLLSEKVREAGIRLR